MPNFNQTLNSINQGMKILEMAQGKGSSSSSSHSSSSSNYPPSNYPPSNYPPSNYPPSNYPSSQGCPSSSLSKIIEGVEKSFLSPPRTSSPRPTSPKPANYNYNAPSNDLQNLFAACNAEISYHQNAIMNLRNLKEMTERNARDALSRNQGKIFLLIRGLKEQESLAARANDLALAAQLASQWQQTERSSHTRQETHQRSLEQNLFEFDRAIQQHQILLDTLSRQLTELHSGLARPPLVDHSIRDPLPFSVPLEEALDPSLSYGGYSSIPPRTPSPSPPSHPGHLPTPGYYAPQGAGNFLAVPTALSPSVSPLPSPPLSSFPAYPPPAHPGPGYPSHQAPPSPGIGFRY